MPIRRKHSRNDNATAQQPAPGRLSELVAEELDIVQGGMSNAEGTGDVASLDGGMGGGGMGGGEGEA